jgi:hypothetical protein
MMSHLVDTGRLNRDGEPFTVDFVGQGLPFVSFWFNQSLLSGDESVVLVHEQGDRFPLGPIRTTAGSIRTIAHVVILADISPRLHGTGEFSPEYLAKLEAHISDNLVSLVNSVADHWANKRLLTGGDGLSYTVMMLLWETYAHLKPQVSETAYAMLAKYKITKSF